jgi:hypothetical protein
VHANQNWNSRQTKRKSKMMSKRQTSGLERTSQKMRMTMLADLTILLQYLANEPEELHKNKHTAKMQ